MYSRKRLPIEFSKARVGASCSVHAEVGDGLTFEMEDDIVCEHLRQLEEELIAASVPERFRGKAWSRNCREWVYFDCYLDRGSIRRRIQFDARVADHELLGCHEGRRRGSNVRSAKTRSWAFTRPTSTKPQSR